MLSGLLRYGVKIRVQDLRTIHRCSAANKNSVEPASRKTDVHAFQHLTSEETEKILSKINTENVDELFRYGFTKSRASKLLAWRKRNGPLKSVKDILFIDGFGVKNSEKMIQNLLNEPKEVSVKKSSPRLPTLITPALDTAQQLAIKSCVSLRIGISSVSWARVELPSASLKNSPCLLTHWQHYEIIDKKLHISDLARRCLYVDHMIPDGDCYIFESPQIAQASTNPGNAIQQNINIQKAQITAILNYAMLCRQKRSEPMQKSSEVIDKKFNSNVFFLKRLLTARLFNHLVGTERVSSEATIVQMMRTFYNTADIDERPDVLPDEETSSANPADIRGQVQFPPSLRQMFSRSERYHREYLGQVLLLNVAFIRLMLLQDPASLALVTRHHRKDDTSVVCN